MSEEKLKTMPMQNFGGAKKCIMGNVEVVNRLFAFVCCLISDHVMVLEIITVFKFSNLYLRVHECIIYS